MANFKGDALTMGPLPFVCAKQEWDTNRVMWLIRARRLATPTKGKRGQNAPDPAKAKDPLPHMAPCWACQRAPHSSPPHDQRWRRHFGCGTTPWCGHAGPPPWTALLAPIGMHLRMQSGRRSGAPPHPTGGSPAVAHKLQPSQGLLAIGCIS